MSEPTFEDIETTYRTQGAAAAIDRLIADLRARKQFHALFDALLMKRRHELGLPLARPTSLDDVPEAQRDSFERFFVDQARHVGELLLAEGEVAQAWRYFRAISEPQQVAQAIETIAEDGQTPDEIIEIALIQGIAPVKGLRLFLATHGPCSTITAFDQQYAQLTPEMRRQCARVLVGKVYDDLRENVQHDVERRKSPPVAPGGCADAPQELPSLRALIAGRSDLFAEGAYHIDVSHLNAVVRFARALDPGDAELDLALQMAEYGAQLSPQYQYAGNAPFEEFYPAHIRYLSALRGRAVDAGLDYFRNKLAGDSTDIDKQLAAFVLVELLLRLGRRDEGLELACRYLADSSEEFGLSLPEMCATAGRFDLLKQIALARKDAVRYTAALLGEP